MRPPGRLFFAPSQEGVSMIAVLQKAKTWLRSEAGPTATEYGILIALLVLCVFATMGQFGERVWRIYSVIDGAMAASS